VGRACNVVLGSHLQVDMTEIAIKVEQLSKCYEIYDSPPDRLKQLVSSGLSRLLGIKENRFYKEFWALNDISFVVRRGETVGIIGRNGSGKSTLLQMICGTLNPTKGSVETRGRVAALLELGSGFNPEFTGKENVRLNAAVLGLSSQQIDEQLDKILAFADIGDFIDQPVKTYSSGMFVRLAFAVAVHVQPEILVVDEALSVGDIAFQNKCIKKIQELKSLGTSILFVSHDLSTVQIVCDKVLWLKNSRLVLWDEPNTVCQEYYADTIGLPMAEFRPKQALIAQQDTGLARFTMLTILDSLNQESTLVEVGAKLTIAFELLALGDLATSVFTISIYRADGDWSVGQTSGDKQIFWPAVQGGQTLRGELVLNPISLTPADYRICLSAFSADLKVCFAMTELTTLFSVRSNYQTWGKFIHPCEWIPVVEPRHKNSR
jgi:ABC-type polysaccharide/polyol phosphate transport system ATPase subunit